jgi:3-oxoacyl-[acyl-carrier protein] reductase
VNYAKSRQGAERVVEAITTHGGKAMAVQGDVSKIADVKRLFADTKRAFGKVTTIVNNAGVFAFQPLEQVTEVEFHRHFGVNVLGPLLMSQEAMNYFGAEGGGIINVGSIGSLNPGPGSTVYSSTKGALETMTIVLARELGPRNIRVNLLVAGATETEGARTAGLLGGALEEQFVSTTPLRRIGQPEDIARVAVFLASEDARWVTGDRILASGGWR